jgi:cytochrome c peroxidase
LILVVMVAGTAALISGCEPSPKGANAILSSEAEETLWDVIDHYKKGAGLQNPYLDEDIQPLALTESDIDDLVAFLASLTSANYKEPGATELTRQRALSRANRPQRDTARAFGPKPPRPAPPE